MVGVDDVADFLDPSLLPKGKIRVAAFDGENADPANGQSMGDGVRAYTPWGAIAYALGGKDGYESVRQSDVRQVAPGAGTLRDLFGDGPTLILLDEISVYLRKVSESAKGRDQLTAFLTSLFKAVEGAPRAALVYTLAVGKGGKATDAYSEENQFVADRMAEAGKVSARKATLLNPTEDDETVQVLRRRLFESIDTSRIPEVVDSYRSLWARNRDQLSAEASRAESTEIFRSSYPLHPEVLYTLTSKTATLVNFQRVRGMLRLLARTISCLWEAKPKDATAIHIHHVDLGDEPTRQEFITRLEQAAFVPALNNDVTAGAGKTKALADEIDESSFRGQPPYAAYVARTTFMHSIAFNDPLKGIAPDRLRYSVLGPMTDFSFVEEARKKFIAESAYLDDRPGAPMRFLVDANLNQIIRREESHVDGGELRAFLNDCIREVFAGRTFDGILFPSGPWDVPDEAGDDHPKLAIMSYDGVAVPSEVEEVPEIIGRIYSQKGAEGSGVRTLRNNLAFVVADSAFKKAMSDKTRRRLALRELKKPERLVDLADYQREQLKELEARSEHDLAIAIQQCYRHMFYPSKNQLGSTGVDLAHSAIDVYSASNKPGAGQDQIVKTLRSLNKLRLHGDPQDSPVYVRDRTPLRKGRITALALRDEFRRDPALPILIGNDTFVRGIEQGIKEGEYVYRRGELLYGPGDPPAAIEIDDQSELFTMTYAKNQGIWPRKSEPPDEKKPKPPPRPPDHKKPKSHRPAETLAATGLLGQALADLWAKARAREIRYLETVTVCMLEPLDGFRLLAVVGTVRGAEKRVTIEGGYGTSDGSSCEVEFAGSLPDVQPLKEFLQDQIRGAKSCTIEVTVELKFSKGLSMDGDAAEKLRGRMTKFVKGASDVKARELIKDEDAINRETSGN